MTRAEVEARRAELMPKLERLLLSLKHWRATNKLKVRYSHEDPRTVPSPTVIPFPTTTH
jgi:hypothetical protein